MKQHLEIENATLNPPPTFAQWLVDACNELAELKRQQRQRQLAQIRLNGDTYVEHDLANRR